MKHDLDWDCVLQCRPDTWR